MGEEIDKVKRERAQKSSRTTSQDLQAQLETKRQDAINSIKEASPAELEGGNISPFSTNYGNKYIAGISREDVELKVNSAHALELEELGFGPPPTTGMTIVEEVPLFGDIPQQKQQAQQSNITVKEGVSEVFESNPELTNIGTLEQYSQYLDTIFPDSRVKDIVYHHSSQKLENFDKSFLGKETSAPDTQLGFFFAEDKNDIPKMVVEKNKQLEELGENKRLDFSVQNNVLLNIKNPRFYYGFIEEAVSSILGREAIITSATARQDYKEARAKLENDNKDALIYGLTAEPDGEGGIYVNKGYVVFEPEQIHILGSKQDIEGFKEFIGNENNAQETQKPPVRRIPKSKKTKTVLDIGTANVTKSEIESKIQENKDHHKDNCNGIIPF